MEHFRLKVEQLLNRLCDEAEQWAEAGSRKPGQLTPQRAVKPLAAAAGAGLPGIRTVSVDRTLPKTTIVTSATSFRSSPTIRPRRNRPHRRCYRSGN